MSLMEKLKTMLDVSEEYEEDPDSDLNEKNRKKEGKSDDTVLKINTTASLQVHVIMPEDMESAKEAADILKRMGTVILNLENADQAVAHRLLDFLSGVAYAYNGQIRQIASNAFLIAPYNVSILGNLLEDLHFNEWNS